MNTITNFGGDTNFVPRHRYTPKDEAEVLEILERHAGGRIRALGSLHSWSDVTVCEDVALDMRYFDQVEISRNEDGTVWATVGGGCVLERLLRALREQTDSTVPAMGVITEQTIAGAISTATHGSGQPSMSHYIDMVRLAAYDPDTGKAKIFEWNGGPELRAARCSLGCMGIILSVRFRCIPDFLVEETVVRRETLEEVLADGANYPLQQFMLVPYRWTFFAFQRRKVATVAEGRKSRLAPLYRAYYLLAIDLSLHVIVKGLLSRLGSPQRVRFFYRRVLPRLTLQNVTVVDRSKSMLTLQHDLFRHEELEIFVPARHIREATELIRHVTTVFAGLSDAPTDRTASELSRIGMLDSLKASRGAYTHHYPILFRKVLPDDTLISMTSGSDEPYYSISFFTYHEPGQREEFYQFVDLLARILVRLYDARLHWGKHFPLAHADVAHLYPSLNEFREICRRTDPAGVFRNQYTERVLGH